MSSVQTYGAVLQTYGAWVQTYGAIGVKLRKKFKKHREFEKTYDISYKNFHILLSDGMGTFPHAFKVNSLTESILKDSFVEGLSEALVK